jgi:hypothetical protein
MKTLELTIPNDDQGELGLRQYPYVGTYPTCSNHGAMNKVSKDNDVWRCLTCNIGGDYTHFEYGPQPYIFVGIDSVTELPIRRYKP